MVRVCEREDVEVTDVEPITIRSFACRIGDFGHRSDTNYSFESEVGLVRGAGIGADAKVSRRSTQVKQKVLLERHAYGSALDLLMEGCDSVVPEPLAPAA